MERPGTDGCNTALLNGRRVEWSGVCSAPLFVTGGQFACITSPRAWGRDFADHLIFPGLVNAHDHLQLNCIPPLPGREEGKENPQISQMTQIAEQREEENPKSAYFPNSYAWMEALQPFRATPAVAAAVAIPAEVRHWHGALKNLLCGVTTVAHHDPGHPIFDDPAFPVQVLREFGWSHSLVLGSAPSHGSALHYGPEVRKSFAATPAVWPWIIHLAEGTDEVAASELEALDGIGCLAANTLLVHGVGLTAADVERVVAHRAGVIWCPSSNLTMLGRTLRPNRLLDAGLLALGTDSRLTGAFDLLEELRLAAVQSDCSPADLLSLVTAAGSRLLRLPAVGGLSCGQQADMVIVRNTGHDPYLALLKLHRAEIRAVVRGGQPAIADPDFSDWFDACGIETARVRLDGVAKLCARSLLGPPGAAELEPGLEILDFGI
jgi:hypothetical protein